MQVTRHNNKEYEGLFDYTLTEDDKKLDIYATREGELIWLLNDTNPDYSSSFDITHENESIFSLFASLYNEIMSYQEVDLEKVTFPINRQKIDLTNMNYRVLTGTGNIEWHCDDDVFDETDVVLITKLEDRYHLEFIHQTKGFLYLYKPGRFEICFSSTNSRYEPFNQTFIGMYMKLQNYNPDYHQIHLNELEYQKRLSK